MKVDIFKARSCRYFVDNYCMLLGELCKPEANIQEGKDEEVDCPDFSDGDK